MFNSYYFVALKSKLMFERNNKNRILRGDYGLAF